MRIFFKKFTRFLVFISLFFCLIDKKTHDVYASSSETKRVDVFDLYGYTKPFAKKAWGCILRESGLLSKEQDLRDRFPPRFDEQALLRDVLDVVEWTQRHWVIRTGTQERWDIKPEHWMDEADPKMIREVMRELGVTNEVLVPWNEFQNEESAICVLGAASKTMRARMEYVKISQGRLILLTGERPVSIGIDGTKEDLNDMACEYGINDIKLLTETHLMRKVYEQSPFYKNEKIKADILDVPKGSLPRPTTETTVLALISWLKEHPEIKKIAFVSNQPHVLYQEAVIDFVFKTQDFPLVFRVVGPRTPEDSTVQSLVGALGSYLWAKAPSLLSKMKTPIQDASLKARLEALYGHQPMVFSYIKKKFG